MKLDVDHRVSAVEQNGEKRRTDRQEVENKMTQDKETGSEAAKSLPQWDDGALQKEGRIKMFGFHKPKMYRSLEGCCICRAKSSSSRFTDSKRYEKDFQNCFGETAAVWSSNIGEVEVVDARAGPSLKTTLKPKKMKTLPGSRMKSNQISKLQKELKRHNSDAHSTTSSASPAQSPCYSNQSDDGSDTEMSPSSSRTAVFSFLDLTYWKRQKVCCGIIYKGRFGEVLIDTHLFKPCCSNKKSPAEKPEPQGSQSPTISNQEEW
ncbi:hypothetical protein JD844_028639 [Phrynosoma platyrhinos]|uniref:SHCAF factor n=1 Tax=Phrynosoma platyrhinos TaxID=52577 RepID=A0ABQ7SI97_PHRPL|nr:hypothetical protein JD844_028639 [Phrynosoma platyrhinos]